jgi:hypothetical protein
VLTLTFLRRCRHFLPGRDFQSGSCCAAGDTRV